MAVDVTGETFQEVVLASTTPVFVDVWAPWCGPCKALNPIIERMEQEFSEEVRFVKLNADDNFDLCEQLNVSNLPTLLMFVGGLAVARKVGGAGGHQGLRHFIASHLAGPVEAAPVTHVEPPPVVTPPPPPIELRLPEPPKPPQEPPVRKVLPPRHLLKR